MNNKSFKKTITRFLGLMAFVATGSGLIISTAIKERNAHKTEILVIIGCFYAISLVDHYKLLILGDEKDD